MNEPRSPAPPADGLAAATVRQLIMGFRVTQLIYVAAKLGLADHLEQGPQTPHALAPAVGADPLALSRLLRALASIGLFAETADGAFRLTPLAQVLQTNLAGSLRGLAILYGEEWLWQAYGHMLYSVQTGRTAFEHVHGEPLYDYLAHHPAAEAQFQAGMSGYSAQEAAAILAAYDFSRVATVVDVGGGHGALVAALLKAHPQLAGVVFDVPSVAAEAERRLAEAGLAARATCVAGDFFVALPSGGDTYLLKSVLHNWDDAAAARILRTCREAMSQRARLLVIERVIPSGNAPAEAKLFDINMLVTAGGQERTEREYRALFHAAGFDLTQIIPTSSPLSLIEGAPAARRSGSAGPKVPMRLRTTWITPRPYRKADRLMTTELTATSSSVTPDVVRSYRENGYVHVPRVLSREEVTVYRKAAREAYETRPAYNGEDDKTFKQILQLWKTDETLRQLTFHTGLATIATQLAGVPLRIWHDQLLIKAPHNGAATEYHQDGPYWPHAGARHQLSAWIALVDVPVERGCMSFIPGTHRRTDIRAADLHNPTDFFEAAPDVTFLPRVTVPLRAGDCTFHHAYLAHTANPNDTDEFRYAFVNIYVDADLTYDGRPHPCTDDLGLEVGSPLPDEEFPRLPRPADRTVSR